MLGKTILFKPVKTHSSSIPLFLSYFSFPINAEAIVFFWISFVPS